ncbi:hypothetical protein R3P38DRAFT_3299369 [Favolaschia claudopus]|uniref:Uncharacterized protein n=2 Tax=Favolaschia claudopus TaxID=2862362 RepID=A0AAV9Z133_9AGAR
MAMDCNESMVTARCSILSPRIRLQRNSSRSFALVFVESNLRPSIEPTSPPLPSFVRHP